MPSVMDYLLDCLPIAAVAHAMGSEASSGASTSRREALRQAPGSSLRRWLRSIASGEVVQGFPMGAAKAHDEYSFQKLPLIWYFLAGTQPDRIGPGAVRVKEMALASHLVFESITWGHMAGDRLVPSVRVFATGERVELELPLDEAYVYAQLWTRGPVLPDAAHDLHPLRSPVDTGLVRIFVYELMSDLSVQPLDIANMAEEEANEYLETMAAFRQLQKGAAGDDRHLGEQLFRHQVLTDVHRDPISGAIGDDLVKVRPTGHRFVVALSTTLTRDIFDFEPTGALAAARILPHVHVTGTMPCSQIEVACRIVRPARTTVLAHLGKVDAQDCGCSEMHDEIKGLLAADANRTDVLSWLDAPIAAGNGLTTGPLPMWGNIFAYYAIDPTSTFGSRPFGMVRRDPNFQITREAKGYVERRAPDMLAPLPAFDSTTTTKLPGQGEFDNVHLAPRMFLEATHARRWGWGHYPGYVIPTPKPTTPWLPVAGRVVIDPIVMAPLCAHDCFHLHWRWSDGFSQRGVFGWNETGPYAKAGAPMVPPHHSLVLSMPSQRSVVLTEHAHDVPANTSEVFFHFGASYGLATDGLLREYSQLGPSPRGGTNMVATVEFGNHRPDGPIVPVRNDSWAAMYWNYRYRMRGDETNGLWAEEYVVHHDLEAAMAL